MGSRLRCLVNSRLYLARRMGRKVLRLAGPPLCVLCTSAFPSGTDVVKRRGAEVTEEAALDVAIPSVRLPSPLGWTRRAATRLGSIAATTDGGPSRLIATTTPRHATGPGPPVVTALAPLRSGRPKTASTEHPPESLRRGPTKRRRRSCRRLK